MHSTSTWVSHAKHTFSKFIKEPSIYCSKAAVSLSYSLTNLKEERAENKDCPTFPFKNLTEPDWLVRLTSDFNTKIFLADILWWSRCPTGLERNNYQTPHSFFCQISFLFCTKCLYLPACSVLKPRRGAWWRAECWRRSGLLPDIVSVCSRSTRASSSRGRPNVQKPVNQQERYPALISD